MTNTETKGRELLAPKNEEPAIKTAKAEGFEHPKVRPKRNDMYKVAATSSYQIKLAKGSVISIDSNGFIQPAKLTKLREIMQNVPPPNIYFSK